MFNIPQELQKVNIFEKYGIRQKNGVMPIQPPSPPVITKGDNGFILTAVRGIIYYRLRPATSDSWGEWNIYEDGEIEFTSASETCVREYDEIEAKVKYNSLDSTIVKEKEFIKSVPLSFAKNTSEASFTIVMDEHTLTSSMVLSYLNDDDEYVEFHTINNGQSQVVEFEENWQVSEGQLDKIKLTPYYNSVEGESIEIDEVTIKAETPIITYEESQTPNHIVAKFQTVGTQWYRVIQDRFIIPIEYEMETGIARADVAQNVNFTLTTGAHDTSLSSSITTKYQPAPELTGSWEILNTNRVWVCDTSLNSFTRNLWTDETKATAINWLYDSYHHWYYLYGKQPNDTMYYEISKEGYNMTNGIFTFPSYPTE